MEAGQSPTASEGFPGPESFLIEKLPAVSMQKPLISSQTRVLSKRRTLCFGSLRPGMLPRTPSHSRVTPGLSACSTRSSSRGSTGRIKKSNTQSLLNLLNATIEPPGVSAKAWAITDGTTGALLFGKQENTQREIASLTKILTCFTCLKLAKSHPGISLDLQLKVSPRAAGMPGTRAGLQTGDLISVRNLLYGLMLPSGNDAAVCLAEGIGSVLSLGKGLNPAENPPERCFVKEMNEFAQEIGMTDSVFRNPHGLLMNGNQSTARDVNLVSTAAMRIGAFRTIVRSQEHCFSIKGVLGQKRDIRWLNTNKLLEVGFDGLKTGITPGAGPCLSASLHSNGLHLIVTLLHSKTTETRWGEAVALVDWMQAQLLYR